MKEYPKNNLHLKKDGTTKNNNIIKIGTIGIGSIGGYLGKLLAKLGYSVMLLVQDSVNNLKVSLKNQVKMQKH